MSETCIHAPGETCSEPIGLHSLMASVLATAGCPRSLAMDLGAVAAVAVAEAMDRHPEWMIAMVRQLQMHVPADLRADTAGLVAEVIGQLEVGFTT